MKKSTKKVDLAVRDSYVAAALPVVLERFFTSRDWASYDDVADTCFNVAEALIREGMQPRRLYVRVEEP